VFPLSREHEGPTKFLSRRIEVEIYRNYGIVFAIPKKEGFRAFALSKLPFQEGAFDPEFIKDALRIAYRNARARQRPAYLELRLDLPRDCLIDSDCICGYLELMPSRRLKPNLQESSSGMCYHLEGYGMATSIEHLLYLLPPQWDIG
jgi:hypothetical protein